MMRDDDLRPVNRAARLRWLETRDAAISAQLHELTRQRTRNRDEATRLRIGLTPDERTTYDAIRQAEAEARQLEAMVRP